ncbi:MAG: 23S rRNA (pseudouridine(1915)-N(3))-methyltransferase RlmH [Candidatus Taylorbacteria bacterium]|nr:23S rRNA (pseudouridine(1915)-N(3))-methyltransferase RlmH [bacterium]MCR4311398.1 23S rRNA (pseudouridine(1915)-N(3))-methyltransferase RlmH [Candidatus Taylorbacteria bacterium]
MKKIIIRAIGKANDPWQKEAIQSYEKRLKPFVNVSIIELPEGHSNSAKPNIGNTLQTEADSLLKSLPENAIIIALDETGKEVPSATLSHNIETWSQNGESLVFLIGGSWGLSDEIRSQANHIISFGKITLPHILARIVLLEQLYRAEMIVRGKEYHK